MCNPSRSRGSAPAERDCGWTIFRTTCTGDGGTFLAVEKRNAPPAPPGAMLDRAGGARDTGVSARAKMSVYFARPTACFHRPTLGAGGAGGRSSRKRKAAVSATGQMSVIFANTGIGYFTFNFFLPREHGNVEATGGSC